MKKFWFEIRLLLLFAFCSLQLVPTLDTLQSSAEAHKYEQYITVVTEPEVEPTEVSIEHTKQVSFEKPTTVNLPVPFFSQAPTGDWGDPYQNACEEMSVLLVQSYLTGTVWTTETIEAEVEQFTMWVAENGYGQSVSIEDLATIVEGYTNLRADVLYNPTVQTLEQLIDAGYPVIVPAAGKQLQNPHFNGDGPWYHMLVVSGYTNTHFITQEVGTLQGKDYEYTKDHLLSSIHNWTGVASEIDQGNQAVLVLAIQ